MVSFTCGRPMLTLVFTCTNKLFTNSHPRGASGACMRCLNQCPEHWSNKHGTLHMHELLEAYRLEVLLCPVLRVRSAFQPVDNYLHRCLIQERLHLLERLLRDVQSSAEVSLRKGLPGAAQRTLYFHSTCGFKGRKPRKNSCFAFWPAWVGGSLTVFLFLFGTAQQIGRGHLLRVVRAH